MTSIAFNARTTAVAVYASGLLRRGKRLLLRLAAANAETRIHCARLESEVYLKYYRLKRKNDDDLPIVG